MIEHVQHRAPGSQRIVLTQNRAAGNTHQYEPNLRHGGAGQCALEIDRKDTKKCTAKHRDDAKGQHKIGKDHIPAEQFTAEDQNTIDARLGQNAREQC